MDDVIGCPACEGVGEYLGTLGRLAWFRCDCCGIEFNFLAEQLPAELEELS